MCVYDCAPVRVGCWVTPSRREYVTVTEGGSLLAFETVKNTLDYKTSSVQKFPRGGL